MMIAIRVMRKKIQTNSRSRLFALEITKSAQPLSAMSEKHGATARVKLGIFQKNKT